MSRIHGISEMISLTDEDMKKILGATGGPGNPLPDDEPNQT